MALTKDQLKAANQSSFPDNTDGLITPQITRDYNDDVIDSLVVSSDTGSFITETTQLNQFTESADIRLNNIETTTASLDISVTNLNSYTSSADGRLNNIETTTASLQSQIDNIDTGSLLETASFDNGTRDITFTKADASTFNVNIPGGDVDTGSLLETASVNLNTITFTKADTTTFDITVDTGSAGGATDITALNEFTSSQLTINSGYNTFTESADSRLNNIETTTASLQTQIDNIDTGSLLETASVLDATITFTKADTTTFGITVDNVVSSSYALFAQDAEDLIIGVKNTSLVTLPKGTPVYATGVTGENINIESASNASSATMPAIGLLNEQLSPNQTGQAVLNGRIIGVNTDGFTAGQPVYVNSDGDFTQTKPTGTALIQNVGVVGKVNATEGEIIVVGAGRSNDVPNITEGYAWVGNGDGVATATSTASWDEKTDITQLNNFTSSQLDINTGYNQFTSSADGRLNNIETFTSSVDISLTNINSYTASTDIRLDNIETTTSSLDVSVTNLNSYTSSTDGRLNNIETFTSSVDISLTNLNSYTASTDGRLDNIEAATGSYAITGSNTFTANQIISGTLDIEGTVSASLGQGLVLVGDANGRTVTAETSSFGGGGGATMGVFTVGLLDDSVINPATRTTASLFSDSSSLENNPDTWTFTADTITIPTTGYYNVQFQGNTFYDSGDARQYPVINFMINGVLNPVQTSTYMREDDNRYPLILNQVLNLNQNDKFQISKFYQISDSGNARFDVKLDGSLSMISLHQIR